MESSGGALSRACAGREGSSPTQEASAPARESDGWAGLPQDAERVGAGRGGPALLQGWGEPDRRPNSPPRLPHDGGWAGTGRGSPAQAQDPGDHTYWPAHTGTLLEEGGRRGQVREMGQREDKTGPGEGMRRMDRRTEGERRLENRMKEDGGRSEARWGKRTYASRLGRRGKQSQEAHLD